MIDPSVLVDALVTKLKAIPTLVSELGSSSAIYAYHDSYPQRVSLAKALMVMPVPSIMVAWQGTGPGSQGNHEVWKHSITLYLRAKQETANTPVGYYKLFREIMKGPVTGASVPLQYLEVHPSFDCMDTPVIQRQTDAEALDYFEIPMVFTEKGDD